MDMSEYARFPKRDDERNAKRWRGPLFEGFRSPIDWMDKYYKILKPPQSVTFPICTVCGHIVWEWPHFEEPVEDNSVCEECFKEAEEEEDRDWP